MLAAAGLSAGAAVAATGDPVEQHTRADMAKARASMLRLSDLGTGWKAVTVKGEPDCRSFHPDESDLVETGAANRLFGAGGSRVGSSAVLYRTTKQALASWRRTVKAAELNCALEGLRSSLPAGARATTVRLGRLAFPSLAPRTAAFRMVTRVTGLPQGSILLYTDVIVLGRGRTIAGLLTGNPGSPVPVTAERNLAAIVALRMR